MGETRLLGRHSSHKQQHKQKKRAVIDTYPSPEAEESQNQAPIRSDTRGRGKDKRERERERERERRSTKLTIDFLGFFCSQCVPPWVPNGSQLCSTMWRLHVGSLSFYIPNLENLFIYILNLNLVFKLIWYINLKVVIQNSPKIN